LLYQAWLPVVAMFPLVILLFPEGRLPSPRWRWVLWSYIGLGCGFLALLTAEASSVILAGHPGGLQRAAHSLRSLIRVAG